MAKFKTWVKAARPRTVLLSFSGVLLGGFLAFSVGPSASSGTLTTVFCALTAILLQILCNFANDYGDFTKGVDGAHRAGPQREMQRGEITKSEMRRTIALIAALCFAFGALLIFVFAKLTWQELAVFAALGIGAVLAAMLYTLGKHPYGYRGLGDLYCFLFFGWAAVAGTFYLATKVLDFSVLLPASAMGFLSNAVLNINNMRDYENDKASGKNSLVVKLGQKKAFIYHCWLIVGAFACLTVFLVLKHEPYYMYAFWLLFPLFFKDLRAIKTTKPKLLDPFLGRQVKHSFLLVLVFGVLFSACQPMPRDVRQAARDALENARIQLDSGNKINAMRLFKEAEHYGLLADDTLTVAHARFNIAKCLGVYADEEEFVSLLKAADEGFGDDYAEHAKVQGVLGDYYQFHRQFDSAEVYLNRAMDYADRSGSIDVKRWVLSAFHVKCFNAGEYEKSGDYMQQFFQTYLPDPSDSVLMYYYHNMGNVYFEMGNMDSMAYCYGRLEEILTREEPDCSAQNEVGWYYGALANFAVMRGDFEKACEYMYWYEKHDAHYEIERQKNNLALISQKYDTAVMQNELNRKIIQKQRIIIFISGIAALVLLAFLVSQIRLARKRKQEAEINAELFHFKQQNQALAQKDAEHEQIQQDYAERLSEALDKEQQTMMLLDIYLNNSKKANLLNDLEHSVFGEKDHWKAMLAVVEEKYPGLWETLGQKYPILDEDEKKSFILSHFKVSRQEEADYLGTTVNMVDKLRGRVRKKMERHE